MQAVVVERIVQNLLHVGNLYTNLAIDVQFYGGSWRHERAATLGNLPQTNHNARQAQCTGMWHRLPQVMGFLARSRSFAVQGELAAIVEYRHGLPRRISVWERGEKHVLKLAKEVRERFALLRPGAKVVLHGIAQLKKGELKRKITAFTVPGCNLGDIAGASTERVIQVCGKKNCWKNGGAHVWQQLQSYLAEGNFQNIRLEKTGCLGNCKNCPSACLAHTGEILGDLTCHGCEALLRAGSGKSLCS